jgi:AcrR family transcriptional regulator
MGSKRRAPAPEERQRDAERSRQQLLSAALEEFAAKGFAGARVQDIAERAGVNKHLINYYFDGKAGLYRELQRVWRESEAAFTGPDIPLDEVAVRYLRRGLADPRPARLMVWQGLEDVGRDDGPITVGGAGLNERKARGELADDLDPDAVQLALMGMIMAPMILPHLVREIFGVDPNAPEFEERYAEQLRRMIKHLTGNGLSVTKLS